MRAVCAIKPQKTENHMRRLNAKRNLIYYPGDIRKPTSDSTTMKLHINSAILDVKSRYMRMDVKDFLSEQHDVLGILYHDTDSNNNT